MPGPQHEGAEQPEHPHRSAQPDRTALPERPNARELVRRRSGTYGAPETGRHHHIGAAPQRQPVLGETPGDAAYVEAAPVQLAGRTDAQLRQQRGRHERLMARAAADLDFEEAARQRDSVAAVDAELARRSSRVPPDGARPADGGTGPRE